MFMESLCSSVLKPSEANEHGSAFRGRARLQETKRRRSRRFESWLDQELSTPHCGALSKVRVKRKWSCELVIRSNALVFTDVRWETFRTRGFSP